MSFDVTSLATLPTVALLAAGIVLLLLGRRLFWLTVGLAGALAGLWLAREVFGLASSGVDLLLALLLGLLGAFLAIFVQRLAVGLVGFFAGAGLLVWAFDRADVEMGLLLVLLALVAGLAGAILSSRLFEVALVVLSSLVGAALIVEASGFSGPAALLVGGALLAAGLLVQARRPAVKAARAG